MVLQVENIQIVDTEPTEPRWPKYYGKSVETSYRKEVKL